MNALQDSLHRIARWRTCDEPPERWPRDWKDEAVPELHTLGPTLVPADLASCLPFPLKRLGLPGLVRVLRLTPEHAEVIYRHEDVLVVDVRGTDKSIHVVLHWIADRPDPNMRHPPLPITTHACGCITLPCAEATSVVNALHSASRELAA